MISTLFHVVNMFLIFTSMRVRKNNRKYKTIEEEGTRLIYNYKVTGDTYYQVYLFCERENREYNLLDEGMCVVW